MNVVSICCDVPITIYYDQVMTWAGVRAIIFHISEVTHGHYDHHYACVVIIMLKATIQLTLFKINIYPQLRAYVMIKKVFNTDVQIFK